MSIFNIHFPILNETRVYCFSCVQICVHTTNDIIAFSFRTTVCQSQQTTTITYVLPLCFGVGGQWWQMQLICMSTLWLGCLYIFHLVYNMYKCNDYFWLDTNLGCVMSRSSFIRAYYKWIIVRDFVTPTSVKWTWWLGVGYLVIQLKVPVNCLTEILVLPMVYYLISGQLDNSLLMYLQQLNFLHKKKTRKQELLTTRVLIRKIK